MNDKVKRIAQEAAEKLLKVVEYKKVITDSAAAIYLLQHGDIEPVAEIIRLAIEEAGKPEPSQPLSVGEWVTVEFERVSDNGKVNLLGYIKEIVISQQANMVGVNGEKMLAPLDECTRHELSEDDLPDGWKYKQNGDYDFEVTCYGAHNSMIVIRAHFKEEAIAKALEYVIGQKLFEKAGV